MKRNKKWQKISNFLKLCKNWYLENDFHHEGLPFEDNFHYPRHTPKFLSKRAFRLLTVASPPPKMQLGAVLTCRGLLGNCVTQIGYLRKF